MAFIGGDIKQLMKIKLKFRQDDLTDQFNRIFMTKMVLCAAMVVGFEYFNDEVACIVPRDSYLSPQFVHSTCWIQGFYIYEEMVSRFNQSCYFGIPLNLDYDGVEPGSGRLCSTSQKSYRGSQLDPSCKPMTKTFYVQYQYLPFFLGALTIAYYLPHILFCISNKDILVLKDTLTGADASNNAESIMNNFFNPKLNSKKKLRMRIAISILIKIMYIVINYVVFVMTDSVLYGRFRTYGLDWSRWMQSKVTTRHDLEKWTEPSPASRLLPPMGFCDVHEASADVRTTYANKFKFICELSPHIIYHYVLLVLWFTYICGIVVSVLGLLRALINYAIIIYFKNQPGNSSKNRVYRALNVREMEYLELIKYQSLSLYEEVLQKLEIQRAGNSDEDISLTHSSMRFVNGKQHFL